jgi:hypothetical protein
MKAYFKMFLGCVIFVGIAGGLLPYLFSQQSDMAVLLGIVVLALLAPCVYIYGKWVFKK